jgi:Spy/CpxP family protein refolding chaperone
VCRGTAAVTAAAAATTTTTAAAAAAAATANGLDVEDISIRGEWWPAPHHVTVSDA